MNFDFDGIADGYVMDPDIADIDKQLKAEGKQGIIYDPSAGAETIADPVANLPDVDDILGSIEKILEYMCKDDIIKLKEEDAGGYIDHMEKKFPAFSFRYFSLFQHIIEGEDLTHLFSMLGAIERVKKGETTLDDAEKDLGEELAQKYVYPHIGKDTLTTDPNNKK